MKRTFGTAIRDFVLLRLAPPIFHVLFRLLIATWRWDVRPTRLDRRFRVRREPFAGGLWHRDIFLIYAYYRHRGFAILVSRSRDGEISTRFARRLGFVAARGSSSRGGEAGLLEMIAHLRAGRGAGTPVDGPRGPARVAKLGMVMAAQKSGAPLVPLAAHATRALRLRNWDRTVVPLPFATIRVRLGEPIAVPAELPRDGLEPYRARLESEIDALHASMEGRDWF